MSKKLKFGIIGCGTIANQKHMPSLSKQPDAELVAFCDIVKEKAEKARDEFGAAGAKVYTDYLGMLEDKAIDVVHICTPNGLHCEMTVAALSAGKHVLCEKPMAANEFEARRMIEAWRKSGKKLTIGYQWRFRPQTLWLKDLCDRGELGDIYLAKAASVRRAGVPTWGAYLSKAAQGGGALIDSGSHSLDLTLWLMNNYRPVSVSGSVFRKLAESPAGNVNGPWDPKDFTVEDSAFAHIKMANGATVFLDASWHLNTAVEQPHLSALYGTKAGADMYEMGSIRINRFDGDTPVIEKPEIPGGNIPMWGPKFQGTYEAEHWVKALLEDTEPLVSPNEAYVVAKIVDAVYTSSETGKTVYFDGE